MNLINNSLLAYYIRRARSWTPAALFAQGQQGVWYEPRPEYLYQDAAGTTPVTADGDPVGLMLDLSGNGNHATQSTSAARPLYPGLTYDGVDDFAITDIDSPSTSPFFISVYCQRVLNNTLSNAIASFGLVGTRELLLYFNEGDLRLYIERSGINFRVSGFLDTNKRIITAGYDGTKYFLRSNNVEIAAKNAAAIDIINLSLRWGAGSSDDVTTVRHFDGDIGGRVYRIGGYTIDDIEATESYLAKLAGVTL